MAACIVDRIVAVDRLAFHVDLINRRFCLGSTGLVRITFDMPFHDNNDHTARSYSRPIAWLTAFPSTPAQDFASGRVALHISMSRIFPLPLDSHSNLTLVKLCTFCTVEDNKNKQILATISKVVCFSRTPNRTTIKIEI